MIRVASSFGGFGKEVGSWDRSRSPEGHVDDLDELSEEDVVWGEGSKAIPDARGVNGAYRSLLSEEIARSSKRNGCAGIVYVGASRGGAGAAEEGEEVEAAAAEVEAGEQEEDEEDGHTLVPPHEIIAREYGPTSPSVLQGTGRTLKGMDLRRLRNAVWLQTGFQD